MELLVKLYSDKPSRIGIKYVYEYMAVREYEALLKDRAERAFSVKIEFYREKINLILQCDNNGAKHCYKALEFKLEQLKRLQAYYEPGMSLEFVHVFPKQNTLMVAKPFRRNDFIRISALEIISSMAAG